MEKKEFSKPSLEILFTVFLRTFLATFAGAVVWFLLMRPLQFLGLADVVLLLLPVFCIGGGLWYLNYAKKNYDGYWSIGVTGILTIFATLIWFVLLFGSSI